MSPNVPYTFGAGTGSVLPSTNQPAPDYSAPSTTTQPSQRTSSLQSLQLPAVDVSALAGISPLQFQAVVNLLRSGALGSAFASSEANGAQTVPSLPTPVPDHFASIHDSKSSIAARVQPAKMEKEDEELEEGEVHDAAPSVRDFLRPPPTGPRDRSGSPRLQHMQQDGRTTPHRHQSRSQVHSPNHIPQKHISRDCVGHREQASKLFLQEMVQEGYTYQQLASNLTNVLPLRRMFRELGLPISADTNPGAVSGATGLINEQEQQAAQTCTQEPIENTHKSATPRRSLPAKPAAVNRNEYLARLQAAKSKRTGPVATQGIAKAAAAPSGEAAAGARPSNPVLGTHTLQNAGSAIPPTTGAPANKAINTELVRQKLEALKAQEAARRVAAQISDKRPSLQASSDTELSVAQKTQNETVAHRNTLGAGITHAATMIGKDGIHSSKARLDAPESAVRNTAAPLHSTTSKSYGGLPGLFMMPQGIQTLPSQPIARVSMTAADSPQSLSSILTSENGQTSAALPNANPVPSTSARKRPVASDFDDSSTKPSAKRPFGVSRGNSEDESFIIEASEDEDEDYDDEDAMETDDSRPAVFKSTRPFRDLPPLRDFPPRSKFQHSSVPSTPGEPTSEGEMLEEKMRAIAELNRQIAERQQRAKMSMKTSTPRPGGRDGDASISAGVYVPSPLPITEQPSLPGALNVPLDDGGLNNLSSSPLQTDTPKSALARRQERERLQQRLRELEVMRSKVHTVEAADIPDPITKLPSSQPAKPTPPVQSSGMPADQVPANIREPQQQDDATPIDVATSLASDGEISDNNMSDLYDVQEPHKPLDLSQTLQNKDNDAVTAGPMTQDEPPVSVEKLQSVQDLAALQSSGLEPGLQSASKHPSVGAGEDVSLVSLRAIAGSQGTSAFNEVKPVQEDQSSKEMAANPKKYAEHRDSEASMQESDDDSSELEQADGRILEQLHQLSSSTHTVVEPVVVALSDRSSEEESSDRDTPGNSSDSSDAGDASVPQKEELPVWRQSESESESLTESDPGHAARSPTLEDNIAPELRPTIEMPSEPVHEEPRMTRFFTPYESPLANFKDYRYHPLFADTVPHGFKSLTYSHRIEPSNPLCHYETAGGTCNDPACDFQHFKQLELTDKTLLEMMCAMNIPARTQQAEEQWRAGLTNVIQELRKEGPSNDASKIAQRIASYRRDFVGDDSKVLNLG